MKQEFKVVNFYKHGLHLCMLFICSLALSYKGVVSARRYYASLLHVALQLGLHIMILRSDILYRILQIFPSRFLIY